MVIFNSYVKLPEVSGWFLLVGSNWFFRRDGSAELHIVVQSIAHFDAGLEDPTKAVPLTCALEPASCQTYAQFI